MSSITQVELVDLSWNKLFINLNWITLYNKGLARSCILYISPHTRCTEVPLKVLNMDFFKFNLALNFGVVQRTKIEHEYQVYNIFYCTSVQIQGALKSPSWNFNLDFLSLTWHLNLEVHTVQKLNTNNSAQYCILYISPNSRCTEILSWNFNMDFLSLTWHLNLDLYKVHKYYTLSTLCCTLYTNTVHYPFSAILLCKIAHCTPSFTRDDFCQNKIAYCMPSMHAFLENCTKIEHE